MKKLMVFLLAALLAALAAGCDEGTADATASPAVTATAPGSSATPESLPTPVPTPASTATTAPTPTPLPSPTPEPLVVTVTKEHRTGVEAEYKYNVYIPIFTVTGSDTLLEYLNEHVTDEAVAILTRFADWAQDNPPEGAAGLNDLTFNFDVNRNDGHILSLSGIASAYMGGASTNSFCFSFNINVLEEKELALGDLLTGNYEPLLNFLIKSRLFLDFGTPPEAGDMLDVSPNSDFADNVKPRFYITPTKLGFMYDKYTIYPGVFGAPVAEVDIGDLPGPFGGGGAECHTTLCAAFNSATGAMTFDYVDILTGNEAISALMTDKGITKDEAEDILYDHDPNEYVRNQNPHLREYKMSDATLIYAVYNPDGTVTPEGYWISYGDFKALYAAHPELVAGDSVLYRVTARDGKVVALEQMFRP